MRLLHRASLAAAFGAATILLMPGFAFAQLSNGSLTVNIDGNSGSIANLQFGGEEFYARGVRVSDYGFQIGTDDTTFQVASVQAGNDPFDALVTVGAGVVTATGTYNNTSNFSFVRQYSLVAGVNALQITTTVTNIGTSSATLRFFEQYDPDQISTSTLSDTDSGTVIATNDAGGDGLSVAGGTLNAPDSITNFINATEFRLTDGAQLNDFYSSAAQFDPDGTSADTSFLFAFSSVLGVGESATYDTYQGFGATAAEARSALAGEPAVVAAAPEPGSIGFLALGSVPLLGAIARRRVSR